MTDTSTSIIGQRFPVLDRGWIELVDMLPHPSTGVSGDMSIVNAARVSFLGESKGADRDKKLLFYLMKHNHGSPFEMTVFKLRIHAPILVFWHLVRYRVMSVNAQSGRYTEAVEDEFYVPTVWRKQSPDNKQASDGVLSDVDSAYLTRKLMSRLEEGYADYELALSKGVAREQARLFLHNFAQYTTWVISINARSLMNVFEQRLPADAQFETRAFVDTMYEQTFKALLPWTSEAFEQFVLNKEDADR